MTNRRPVDRSEGEKVGVDAVGHVDGPDSARLVEYLGAHYGPGHQRAFELCRQSLGDSRDLVHLAQYTAGVGDFTVDRIDGSGDGGPSEGTLDDYRSAGRNLVHDMADLDEELQQVQSGDLIRLVVHADQAALFGFSVLRNRFLVGLAHTPPPGVEPCPAPRVPAIRAADIEVSALANRLRAVVSQRPTDYGGWLWLSERDLVEPAALAAPSNSPGNPPTEVRDPDLAEDDEDVQHRIARCRDALDVEDLHFAAVCRYGAVSFSVDVLGDDRLSPFFDSITVAQRRRFYRDFGARIESRLRGLLRSVYPVVGRRLARAVFDVEQGALYCYPIRPGEFLLGVTLDQNRVGSADDKVARLARDLGD
ncbi:hypothetical protein GCM10027280_56520 [Micromonospora polyrhachis]|uniref:Uncharacterized protein n=1 Tax=Micromonospora polyrhachis TaxID=1282883 RepID=A0A7W7SNG1_9ACTN|nr:hypothetical protein [Micromonospora polyrhachis]MBB4958000.1 hypothetical protein [Micromonospora polyrhachis]